MYRIKQSAPLDLFGLSCLGSVMDQTSFHTLLLQVSLRYHCRLYNEWRQTNQRVVLLLPKSHSDSLENPSVTGLLSIKRPSKESIVWLYVPVDMNANSKNAHRIVLRGGANDCEEKPWLWWHCFSSCCNFERLLRNSWGCISELWRTPVDFMVARC